jgi:hypothetical protein
MRGGVRGDEAERISRLSGTLFRKSAPFNASSLREGMLPL